MILNSSRHRRAALRVFTSTSSLHVMNRFTPTASGALQSSKSTLSAVGVAKRAARSGAAGCLMEIGSPETQNKSLSIVQRPLRCRLSVDIRRKSPRRPNITFAAQQSL